MTQVIVFCAPWQGSNIPRCYSLCKISWLQLVRQQLHWMPISELGQVENWDFLCSTNLWPKAVWHRMVLWMDEHLLLFTRMLQSTVMLLAYLLGLSWGLSLLQQCTKDKSFRYKIYLVFSNQCWRKCQNMGTHLLIFQRCPKLLTFCTLIRKATQTILCSTVGNSRHLVLVKSPEIVKSYRSNVFFV